MFSIPCTLALALFAQPGADVLAEQQEFEATIATEEGCQHVLNFVRRNRLLPFGFDDLVASAVQSEIEDVPSRAIWLLHEIGADAAEHADVVLPFLAHEVPNLRRVAVECLETMHPGRFYPEIAHLAVFDEDHFVQGSAVRALIRSESLEAVPFILAVYLDESPVRAAHAIRWTNSCSPDLQRALIPGLIQVLRRTDSAPYFISSDSSYPKPLREDAIDILGGMGEIAAPYLPEIERMRELEEDPAMLIRYAVATINIDGIDKKQVDLVRDIMETGDVYMRRLACDACIDSPLLAEALRSSLVALAEHKDPYTRDHVAWTFRYTDLSGPDVTAALQTLATDYNEELFCDTCWNALHALAERGELENPLDSALTAMGHTEFGESDAYWVVVEALGEAGAKAAIVEDFATADSIRREQLMEVLFWGPNRGLSDTYHQLLELPLSEEEHEHLSHELQRSIEYDTPRPPITDWRLPMTEVTEGSPDATSID